MEAVLEGQPQDVSRQDTALPDPFTPFLWAVVEPRHYLPQSLLIGTKLLVLSVVIALCILKMQSSVSKRSLAPLTFKTLYSMRMCPCPSIQKCPRAAGSPFLLRGAFDAGALKRSPSLLFALLLFRASARSLFLRSASGESL